MHRHSLFWGIVITIFGILLLINQIWSFDIFRFLMPTILIIIGAWFLIVPRFYSRELNEEQVSIPLDGISEADVRLQHGAGTLKVANLTNSENFLCGTFNGGVDQTVERLGDRLKVRMQPPPNFLISHMKNSDGINCWNLNLNPNIPINLDIKGGASETRLDLTNLIIPELKLETGASSTEIFMPSHAGYTKAEIHAGAASINIRIPESVAVRITTKGSGISDIQVNQNRFPATHNGYESPDYQKSDNKIDISIEIGLGSINIR